MNFLVVLSFIFFFAHLHQQQNRHLMSRYCRRLMTAGFSTWIVRSMLGIRCTKEPISNLLKIFSKTKHTKKCRNIYVRANVTCGFCQLVHIECVYTHVTLTTPYMRVCERAFYRRHIDSQSCVLWAHTNFCFFVFLVFCFSSLDRSLSFFLWNHQIRTINLHMCWTSLFSIKSLNWNEKLFLWFC